MLDLARTPKLGSLNDSFQNVLQLKLIYMIQKINK